MYVKLNSCVRAAVAAGAFLAMAGVSTIASAVGFSGSYVINALNSDPGLVIETQEMADPLNFVLNSVGDTHTVNLFKIWTDETDVGGDDRDPYAISVLFDFTAPASSGGVSGMTVGGGFVWEEGRLAWNGPGLINFGNGGVLQVTLTDEVFNGSLFGLNPGKKKGAIVEATFELVSDSVQPIPLPASLPLFMAALGGLAVLRRRARAQA
jgi:hypothetical protein